MRGNLIEGKGKEETSRNRGLLQVVWKSSAVETSWNLWEWSRGD